MSAAELLDRVGPLPLASSTTLITRHLMSVLAAILPAADVPCRGMDTSRGDAAPRRRHLPQRRRQWPPADFFSTRLVGALLVELDEHGQLDGRRRFPAEGMAFLPDLEDLPSPRALGAGAGYHAGPR